MKTNLSTMGKVRTGLSARGITALAAGLGFFAAGGVARASVVIEPALLMRYAEWEAADLPPAPSPELEPVVALSTLVVALQQAMAIGGLELTAEARAGVAEWLAPLTEEIVLSRRKAVRKAEALFGVLPAAAVGAVVRETRKPYSRRVDWLGGLTPLLNPLYDPASLPGWAARDLLRRMGEGRAAETKGAAAFTVAVAE